MVMHYLYKGGCENLDVNQNDVLELMAAANFFQLDGLLRFCESRCSTLVDLDNIVSMYIHAKVHNECKFLIMYSTLTSTSSLRFRFITLFSCWNTAKVSYCKTWWLS